MRLPTAKDLHSRDDLVPVAELADRIAEAIRAVEKHERKAVVTLTYNVDYDQETEKLSLRCAIKDKRPVRSNRNEEVLGEPSTVFAISRQDPGQQALPGTSDN